MRCTDPLWLLCCPGCAAFFLPLCSASICSCTIIIILLYCRIVVLVKYELSTTVLKKYALDAFTSLEGDVELVDGSCNVPSFGSIVSAWASHRRPQASSTSSIWPDLPLIHKIYEIEAADPLREVRQLL